MNNNPAKVITGPETRFSYCSVWEPKSINGGEPRYSVSILIPKTDKVTVGKIREAIQQAYHDGESKLKGKGSLPPLSALKTPLRDGDTERPDDPAYAGMWFLNANSTRPPQIVDGSCDPILDRSEGDLLQDAEEAQRTAMEKDDRLGMVENYLDTLLPEDWPSMNVYQRRTWLQDTDDPTRKKGSVSRSDVSNVEIWSECFGRNPAEMKSSDSYAIAALMAQLSGWKKTERIRCLPFYGRQRLYCRVSEIPDFLL